ncbi:MAG: serpin family protein [Cyanobacteria bacterium J06638_22]
MARKGIETHARIGQYRLPLAIASSLLVLGVLGCAVNGTWADDASQSERDTPTDVAQEPGDAMPSDALPQLDDRLVAAHNAFGFNLFSQILPSAGNENVMISPSSVAIALAMTYNGASGETQDAMAQALELQGMSLDEINQANAALETILEQADPQVKIGIANSLWGREGVAFDEEFLQRNQTYYNAEVQRLDFADAEATDIINEWVSDSTEGRIPQIIQRIQPEQVLFLINAVYFNGTWSNPFDPALTQDQSFTLADGSSQMVPMMRQAGRFRYTETAQFQAVHLPYGDRRLSMMVVLPREGVSLSDFQQTLTPENWSTWQTAAGSREGMVQLPRFESEFGTQLNDALKALGMERAFDPDAAEFDGMSQDAALYISDVQHRTFIKVDEAGTEAAASTSVGIGATSAPMDPPFQMVCDRPFFYAIQDNETGAILFMGTMMNPAS